MKVLYNKKLMEVELKYDEADVLEACESRCEAAKVKKKSDLAFLKLGMLVSFAEIVLIIACGSIVRGVNDLSLWRFSLLAMTVAMLSTCLLLVRGVSKLGVNIQDLELLKSMHKFVELCNTGDKSEDIILKESNGSFTFLFGRNVPELDWVGEVCRTKENKITVEVTNNEGLYKSCLYIPAE